MSARVTLILLVLLLLAGPAVAQTPAPTPAPPPTFSINLGSGGPEGTVSTAIQLVFLMTVLTLAPSIMMLMTSFTRIVIVLGFVRSALGVQSAPSNQIIIGLSLFLTLFLMAPIGKRINEEALKPYMAGEMQTGEALDLASRPLKQFMLAQTRAEEVDFFLGMSGTGRTTVEALPMTVVIPSFVVSELRTSFQMGFMIFIPFLIIDFLVAATLMSMGMMMMPPVMISLPFKLLLFVLVDGWHLVIRSLVESFGV